MKGHADTFERANAGCVSPVVAKSFLVSNVTRKPMMMAMKCSGPTEQFVGCVVLNSHSVVRATLSARIVAET